MEWLDVQIREIAALNKRHHHSVVLHTPSSDATAKMSCFTCALDIDPDAISDMCLEKIFPGAEFVDLMRGALRTTDRADADCIVVYLDSVGSPKHAGKIGGGGRITSKWGGQAEPTFGSMAFGRCQPSMGMKFDSLSVPLRDGPFSATWLGQRRKVYKPARCHPAHDHRRRAIYPRNTSGGGAANGGPAICARHPCCMGCVARSRQYATDDQDSRVAVRVDPRRRRRESIGWIWIDRTEEC